MYAIHLGPWARDHGATVAASVAAVLAAVNLFVTWKAKRNEWLRSERISRYSALAGAAASFSKVAVKTIAPPTPELLKELQESEAAFEDALAAVLIVGPEEVCRRASLFQSAIAEMPQLVRQGAEPVNLARAMNEYIKECSKAIDTKHDQEDVDFERWKASPGVPLARWP